MFKLFIFALILTSCLESKNKAPSQSKPLVQEEPITQIDEDYSEEDTSALDEGLGTDFEIQP